MNTDRDFRCPFSPLKDLIVFSFTVVICGLFLYSMASCRNIPHGGPDSISELATLRPPAPLQILPAPFEFVPGPLCVSPEIELALTDAQSINGEADLAGKRLPKKKIPFHGIIVQVAGRYRVDPHLIQAIILAESGYNPNAKSKKGARGLMQLMPSTAKAMGIQDIYDPAENIEGGVRYFRSLLDRFKGDVQLALAAYNAGSRHVRNYDGIPPFKATRRYIKKVLKFQAKFKMNKIAA